MSNDAADPDVQAQLQSLRQRYQQSLPERLSGLDALWQQLCREGWNEATARSLMLELHSLAGGAPTFGYPALGQSARAMEYQLQQWLDLGGLPPAMECDRFRGRIQALTQRAGQAEGRLVYLYAESGIQDIVHLYEPLKHFGYNARLLHDLQALAAAVEEERPLAIVCRSEGEPTSTAFTTWLEGAQTGKPSIPVIFIAQGGGFEARLQAVRLGGQASLQPPLEISELVERLDGLTAESEYTPYRVLLVDDDVPLARHYALVLGEAGMEVETAHEPACVMERLDAFKAGHGADGSVPAGLHRGRAGAGDSPGPQLLIVSQLSQHCPVGLRWKSLQPVGRVSAA